MQGMFLLFSPLAYFEKNKAIGCKTLQGGLFENKVKEKHKLYGSLILTKWTLPA